MLSLNDGADGADGASGKGVVGGGEVAGTEGDEGGADELAGAEGDNGGEETAGGDEGAGGVGRPGGPRVIPGKVMLGSVGIIRPGVGVVLSSSSPMPKMSSRRPMKEIQRVWGSKVRGGLLEVVVSRPGWMRRRWRKSG